MKHVLPYLSFDGNCREAMAFYKQCFGGQLDEMTFGGSKEHFDMPPGAEDRIIHSALHSGTFVLMASDSMPGMPFTVGNDVSVLVVCDSDEEVGQFYDTLKDGGHEVMPPADAFWGARFAMCADKFGINWMLSHEKVPTGATQGA
jgi:PhnB protein